MLLEQISVCQELTFFQSFLGWQPIKLGLQYNGKVRSILGNNPDQRISPWDFYLFIYFEWLIKVVYF